jgi:hypothetical protein
VCEIKAFIGAVEGGEANIPALYSVDAHNPS